MGERKIVTKELIDLKFRVMLERLTKLCNIFEVLGEEEKVNHIKEAISNYTVSYNEIIESGDYEKYDEVEQSIIKTIAPIELFLDEYVFHTTGKFKAIVKQLIDKLRNSSNYINFENFEELFRQVRGLKDLAKRYTPFAKEDEEKRVNVAIRRIKFDVSWREIVKKLVCGPPIISGVLMQYDDEVEKEYFIEKINDIISFTRLAFYYGIKLRDEPFIESDILQKLVKTEIAFNSKDYIGLLNAKIFNPHLCNIEDDPYEKMKEVEYRGRVSEIRSVNLSLLYTVLCSFIGDEDTSIIECERIYQRFGFNCRPIITNEGQNIVYTLFRSLRETKEFEDIMKSNKPPLARTKQYCVAYLPGLDYSFLSDTIPMLTDNALIDKVKQKIEKLKKEADNLSNMHGEGYAYAEITKEKEYKLEALLANFINLMKYNDIQSVRKRIALKYKIITVLYCKGTENFNKWKALPLEDLVEDTDGCEVWKVSSIVYDSFTEQFDDFVLWKSYQEDSKRLGIDIRQYGKICYRYTGAFKIAINLDDIKDLPLYNRLQTVTEEEIDRENEEGEER